MMTTPRVILSLAVFTSLSVVAAEPIDPVDYVDPLIGVDGGGAVFPGAIVPFGLVSLSPDTNAPQNTSGYRSNRPIIGFSHNHSSGTGGTARYGNLLVMPQTGEPSLGVLSEGARIESETAAPGYYAATFVDSGVRAELTASARSGVHRYTFPNDGPARILFDVTASRNTRSPDEDPSSKCTAAEARIVSDRGFEGQASFEGGWGGANPHTVFFAAEFDRPFDRSGGWEQETFTPGASEVSGLQAGLFAEFDLAAGETVGLQVGVSYLSLENARKNLAVTKAKSFDEVRADAVASWRDYLDRIRITGGTPDERTIFYTALYRTAMMPNDVTGEVPGFPEDEPHYWNFYCIWDTYHTVNPLYTLIDPKRQADLIRSLIAVYEKHGWLPDAWIAGGYGSIQGGTHADTLIADAVVKDVPGFDREKAYAAIRKNATEPGPALDERNASWGNIKQGRFPEYFTLGYLPIVDPVGGNMISCPTSRTLEYSVNDYSVATVARALGKTEDAERFENQSRNAWTLWNPETKFFWAKDHDGKWAEGFRPDMRLRSYRGPYYEGSPWHYVFAMRHDVQGLVERLGGPEATIEFLDEYFDGGFHTQQNQPTLLTPWLHTYAGRPDKNVDRVRAGLRGSYQAARLGLPGNDDAGTMSAWYVFGAMGFYPVTGQDIYLLASPIFDEVTVQLGDSGKTFVISAPGRSEENRYVQSATLNGKPWNQAWFRHGDIIDGAELILTMGPQPSEWGTQTPPPSLTPTPTTPAP